MTSKRTSGRSYKPRSRRSAGVRLYHCVLCEMTAEPPVARSAGWLIGGCMAFCGRCARKASQYPPGAVLEGPGGWRIAVVADAPPAQ